MFMIIETTTSRTLFKAATIKEIRAYLKQHYVRFYVIMDCDRKVQVNYFGKEVK